MKLSLTPRERNTALVGSLLAALVLWLYGAFLISPMLGRLAGLGGQVRKAREEIRLLEAGTASEAALRDQYRQVSGSVDSLRRLLPTESDLPRVIERLSQLAEGAKVKIQTIAPQRESEDPAAAAKGRKPPEGPALYEEVLITSNALAGYHQLGAFLGLVEAEGYPLEVHSLWISGDSKESKRHQIKLTFRSYFAASPPEKKQGSVGQPGRR